MIINLPLCGDIHKLVREAHFVNITGDNGVGKSLLAADLASHFLDRGWSFVSNLPCVWNDNKSFDYPDPGLPTFRYKGDKLHTIVYWEEGGSNIRTRATITDVLIQKRKLGLVFILPSIDLPHEDLLGLVIHPSPIITNNFKVWLYEKSYRNKIVLRPFLQILSPAFYNIYQSGAVAADSSFLLSWITQELQNLTAYYGDYKANKLRDLVKPDAGLESSKGGLSFLYERGTQIPIDGVGRSPTGKKAKNKSNRGN